MDFNKVKLISLPKILDKRGNLTFIQQSDTIPFEINYAKWIYDVPGGQSAGSLYSQTETHLITVLTGSFDATVDDGIDKYSYHLNRPNFGLLIPPQVKCEINNVATNSVALILSDKKYSSNLVKPQQFAGKEIDKHQISTLGDCKTIDFERHISTSNDNGDSSSFSNSDTPIFDLKRVYYLYDVPADSERGGHSHFVSQRLIIAATGCFDVTLDDGHERKTFTLNRPYKALYVPAGIWLEINNFSSGSVCLSLTSTIFDEKDYCRQYDIFKKLTEKKI